jgi:hypothetical protein
LGAEPEPAVVGLLERPTLTKLNLRLETSQLRSSRPLNRCIVPEDTVGPNTEILQDEPYPEFVILVMQSESTRTQRPNQVSGKHTGRLRRSVQGLLLVGQLRGLVKKYIIGRIDVTYQVCWVGGRQLLRSVQILSIRLWIIGPKARMVVTVLSVAILAVVGLSTSISLLSLCRIVRTGQAWLGAGRRGVIALRILIVWL